MARIRSLKPSFFKSEDLASLSPWHRLCYEGLWCWADREGRLEDRPRRLKAEIFPYDDLEMEPLLDGLAKAGFIIRYAGCGKRYIAIPTFADHQIPKKDERESVIPPPDPAIVAVPQRDSDGTDTVPRVGQGTEDIRTEDRGQGKVEGPTRRAEDLQTLWNEITKPPIPRCRELTPKRKRHISARFRERTFEDFAEIFSRIQASPFCRGEGGSGNRGHPWVASFDWIIESADNAAKVLEGKYDDRASQQPAASLNGGPWVCDHLDPCSHRAMCEHKLSMPHKYPRKGES